MSYREDYRSVEEEAFWTMPRLLVGTVSAIFVFFLIFFLTQPLRMIAKNVDANVVQRNYEDFFNMNELIKTRIGQIASHKDIIRDNDDKAEYSRLQVELSGMKQSCREIVGRYNAQSAKLNSGFTRSSTLPVTHDSNICN
jgi:hypothetical protein